MTRTTTLTASLIVLATLAATGPSQAANVVNKFNDWTLYSNVASPQICFLAGTAAPNDVPGLKRTAPLMYISAWPKDGVKSEVSIKLGFPPKKASEPTIAITGQVSATFKLFVKDDRAFVADATQELKLIEAMKKGSKLTVQSTQEAGTMVIDTYSLAGVTSALQALAAGCP
jgi:invasion protein IalB